MDDIQHPNDFPPPIIEQIRARIGCPAIQTRSLSPSPRPAQVAVDFAEECQRAFCIALGRCIVAALDSLG